MLSTQVNYNSIVMSKKEIENSIAIEKILLEQEQQDIETLHHFHAGIYSRTILIKKNIIISGALIKIPTILYASGDLSIYIGKAIQNIKGYGIITADANRKQIIYANEDSYLTMAFATKAQTVKEAEKEFTDEYERLLSNNCKNTIIKGNLCQEQ